VVAAVVEVVVELHKHFAVLLPQNLAVAAVAVAEAEAVKEPHC
jgi:hypothetical protein